MAKPVCSVRRGLVRSQGYAVHRRDVARAFEETGAPDAFVEVVAPIWAGDRTVVATLSLSCSRFGIDAAHIDGQLVPLLKRTVGSISQALSDARGQRDRLAAHVLPG